MFQKQGGQSCDPQGLRVSGELDLQGITFTMGSSVDVNAFRQLLGRNIPPLPVLNLKTGEHTTLDTCILSIELSVSRLLFILILVDTERHRVIVLCFWSTWYV